MYNLSTRINAVFLAVIVVFPLTLAYPLKEAIHPSTLAGRSLSIRFEPVPPAGSGTFNPGTLSHPLSTIPLEQLVESESSSPSDKSSPSKSSSSTSGMANSPTPEDAGLDGPDSLYDE